MFDFLAAIGSRAFYSRPSHSEPSAPWPQPSICRTAGFGCLDCKDILLKNMVPPLEKIRERRQQFVEKPDRIVEILHEGSRRARAVAARTMEEVRAAVHLTP